MAGFTNRGALRFLEMVLRQTYDGGAIPANFYVAFVTGAAVPDEDTKLFSELTEITAGNGYTTGGISLTPGSTDFDVLAADDVLEEAQVQAKDVGVQATGGTIPAAGAGASYAVFLNDDAVVADREVLAYWSLGVAREAAVGQFFTLQDLTFKLTTQP